MNDVLYYGIALDTPIFKLFTYKSNLDLKKGSRVLVSFRNKKKIGIVWEKNIIPTINENYILNILKTYNEEIFFNDNWLKFIEFTSRYYHYPIGTTIFCALPNKFKQDADINISEQNYYYLIKSSVNEKNIPAKKNTWEYKLWNIFKEKTFSKDQLKKIYPQANKILNKWLNLNLIEKVNKNNINIIKKKQISLTKEQQNIKQNILKSLNEFKTFLLHGITGSGKTEVYFEIIFEVIKQNKQVLFLIPEINLTVQLINRINKYFIDIEFVILNSKISNSDRIDVLIKAKNGDCKLIIGTRLAIFTPIKSLGLIIIDEEQDRSFKQDNQLRYQARDLAVYLAKQNNCPIILGSATPSLESWHNVLKGNYNLLKLKNRAKKYSKLPKINIINIKHQKLINGFSNYALKKLEQNLNKGLSFIYINRRGYAPVVMCSNCEYIFSCSNCSANLVYHSFDKTIKCHHCGHQEEFVNNCPNCKSNKLITLGLGTQKIEEFITNYFNKSKIIRIDKDKTNKKNDWNNIYNKINNNEANIIIGTQMLAKGHDFSNLNLVVILNADSSLYSTDFRSREKLFTEIIQVSGRAGRDKIEGEVLIQTNLPENSFFKYIVKQDYEAFAQLELENRNKYSFVPYKYIVSVKARSAIESNAFNFLKDCKQNIYYILEDVNILGPTPQAISKIDNQERFQIFFESSNRNNLHSQINKVKPIIEKISKKYRNLNWLFDTDPYEY